MKPSRRIFSALVLFALVFLAGSSGRAATVYALTDDGHLLTFDHQMPGTLTNNVSVSGLGGYELLAIDVRPTVQPSYSQPGVGTLWGIGRSGASYQLFVIDPATGAATAIGAPIGAGINGAPAATEWGFDFNPSTDRIRLVDSSARDNYQLNPNNGALLVQDAALAYATGDAHVGTAPQVDAAAYTTAVFGGATSLYYIDSNLDILAISTNPDSGELHTVGTGLGVNIDQPNGFDIYGGLALFSVPGVTGSSLYSLNTTTGTAQLIGAFPTLPTPINVRGLAISIAAPPPVVGPPFLRVIGKQKRTTTSSRVNLRIQSHDDSGIVAVSFRQTKLSSSYKFLRSTTNNYVAIVRRLQFGNNPVIVRSVDPEGNQSTKRVVIVRHHPAIAAP